MATGWEGLTPAELRDAAEELNAILDAAANGLLDVSPPVLAALTRELDRVETALRATADGNDS
jgi:hypothetical protein